MLVSDFTGAGISNRFSSLGEALKFVYPEYPWIQSRFSYRGKKSGQRWLYFKMKELLPNATIIEEYNHPDLVWGMHNYYLMEEYCFMRL